MLPEVTSTDLVAVQLYDLPPASSMDVYWRAVASTRIRKKSQYRIKRVVDLVVASLLLAAVSPLVVALALLIKATSRGPIFYRQVRLGRDWTQFTLLKFRTMIDGADTMLDEVRHLNEANGPLFKARKDPRVTLIGRVLRATFLDELPQLINVIRGEMSLVGPRPCLPSEAAQMEQEMYFRFAVPQGITGPWQISGYHAMAFADQLHVERDYVESWVLAKDLQILLRTIPVLLAIGGR